MTFVRRLCVVGVIGAAFIAGSCVDRGQTVDTAPQTTGDNAVPTEGNTVPTVDAGTSVIADAGVTTEVDAGSSVIADAGFDAGSVDAGSANVPDAGPWPTEAVRDYTHDFAVGKPQSVALDEGLNLWLLDGDRIGFLRPGDAAPKWSSGIGQARNGFGPSGYATRSTVICGGAAGQAYVGYATPDLQPVAPGIPHAFTPSPGQPYYSAERYAEYQKGDLDAVQANVDGSVVLQEHIWRSIGSSNPGTPLGIHNTNDYHYDEDRSVYACERMTRGPYRGDLFITTNHGATMIKGLQYNSHRHPGWYKNLQLPDGTFDQALQTTEMYGLGIGQNGDVLVANEQMVGALVPDGQLLDWDRENTWDGPVPWRFKFFNESLNSQDDYDYWRAFQQVKSGGYYLGSSQYGLWALTIKSRSDGQWTKVTGLPSNQITSLKATDDGALYIGTENAGLWRMEPDGTTLTKVAAISSSRIRQLVYEPTVTPTMLLVVTDAGLTVLRGP